MSATATLLQAARAAWAPPPELTVSAFADREIIVTTGPLAGTHWQTSFAPYQRAILDAFHEPGVEIVVVMGSSQWGKTSIAVNLAAYHMAWDPCPILAVAPTVDPLAKDFARNRLDPVIAASPALAATVSRRRSRDASNTTLMKTFRGGSLSIGGANSAASLAARSIRLLILDEIDRYPAELPGEGSTLSIAMKRTTAYRRRRRILMTSSPTLKGAPIDAWFQRGDQRHYYVPCPACAHMHAYQWANVRWTDHVPSTARLICPACQHPIDDAERVAILAEGEWRAEKPERVDKAIVSFHIWEAYSPLSSLTEIVTAFLRARTAQRAGDRSEMHTWINTTLGEPVEPDDGEGVEPHTLLLRRESYGAELDAPMGVCVITMGVDVQDDRLEALVIGWGPGEESWLLDRAEIPGDTSRPEPWADLDRLLGAYYRHPVEPLPISATCIDSGGHRTNEVYDYVHRRGVHRVYATIGRDGNRQITSSPSPRGWGRGARKVRLYTVGVDAAKASLMARLLVTEKGPGFVHIPSRDWADEELVLQLTAERLVTKFTEGRPISHWRQTRTRNEMLDCAVLAHAALRLFNPQLKQWAEALEARRREREEGADAEPKPPTPPRKPPWLGARPRGWLK